MRTNIIPLLTIAGLVLASCSSYYFASPQPTDRRDLTTIPRQLRGAWWSLEDEDTPPDYASPANYTVERKRIRVIKSDSLTYIDRVLTLEEAADTTRDISYDSQYSGIQSLDTLSGSFDTTINLILSGSLAYPVDNKGIGRGHPYSRSGDTIRLVKRDTTIHDLGHYLRVRKIEKSRWALNFLDGDQREAKGWWLVLIAEHRGDTAYMYSAVERMDNHPSRIGQKDDKYYFNLDMRAAEMGNLTRDSLFAPTFLLVR